MKKQLNVDRIQSELSGGSAFFPGYKGSGSPAPSAETPEPAEASEQPGGGANARSVERSNGRTPVRDTTKRIVTRNSFEIYEDQMDSLRRLSFQEKVKGAIGSMSAMVREAIDTYLKEHLSEK
jgi:hypothetical protein